MRKKTLILFDFDGVVIDNSEGIFNCINYAADKIGLPRPAPETLRAFVGPPLYDSFCRYMGADHETALRLVEAYRERYRPVGTAEAVLYPGIEDLLSALAAEGRTLAVCSGKPRDFVIKIAGALGVDAYFSAFYGTTFQDTHLKKADYIRQAMTDFGAAPENTVMIGDTPGDIAAAKEAGVESIGALYGFAVPGALESSGAAALAANAGELRALLAGTDTEN